MFLLVVNPFFYQESKASKLSALPSHPSISDYVKYSWETIFFSVSDTITIRQANVGDAKLLTDLSYTTFWDAFAHHPKNAPDDLAHYMRQAFSIEQISAELASPESIFLIASLDEKPAGYAKMIVGSTEEGITAERPIELSRLYSHQEYLGKGVGQNLMQACFERAVSDGNDVMWLGVWEYNPRAQRFYERNGFRVVGRHTFQLGADPQTDLLMQKEMN